MRPPLRARDYRMDWQFSFRILIDALHILVASGIDAEPHVEVDVLLVGADAKRDQLAEILGGTLPFLVLPNHWDDMFRPLSQPTRPMIVPPPTILPTLKRIDLNAWVRMVHALAPAAEVLIPNLFEQIPLGILMP